MTKPTVALVACVAALAGCLAWFGLRPTRADDTAGLKPLLRRPVALALVEDGRWLFAANRRAGTISVIDTTAARTVAEVSVGGKPADLVATPDTSSLLTVDEEAGELVVLDRKGSGLKVARRVKVSAASLR